MTRTVWLAMLGLACLAGCSQEQEPQQNAAAPAHALTASEAAEALARAGLPVTDVVVMSPSTDPDKLLGQPGQYSSKVIFHDARHPKGKGADTANVIETFASIADAMRRAEVVTAGAKNPDDIARYQMLQGKVYLRLGKALLPQEADEYRKAMQEQGIGS